LSAIAPGLLVNWRVITRGFPLVGRRTLLQ
jgi:hypothetical protein